MKTNYLLLAILLCLASFDLNAQNNSSGDITTDKISLGAGVGLDYGGFGANLFFYPQRNFGLFAGVGYAFAGVGFNAGAKYRFIPSKPGSRTRFYLNAMYGYNAAIAVLDASEFDKLFYGPSFGGGFDFLSRRNPSNYWSFALLVPIRGSDVNDYIDDLKNNHGIEMKTKLYPIAYSIGYHWMIN